MIRKIHKKILYSQGYALMLSIVVSSVVLSIGLSLLNIVQKELILSGTGRDSQFAFYAADAGLECTLYWDIKELKFPANSSDWAQGTPPTPGIPGNDCGNTDFGNPAISRYTVGLDDNGPDGADPLYNPGDPDAEPPVLPSGYYGDTITIGFQVDFSNAEDTESHGSCATISITKQGNGQSGDTYKVQTTVDARGYNDACAADGVFDNPALVERAIRVTY